MLLHPPDLTWAGTVVCVCVRVNQTAVREVIFGISGGNLARPAFPLHSSFQPWLLTARGRSALAVFPEAINILLLGPPSLSDFTPWAPSHTATLFADATFSSVHHWDIKAFCG